MDKKEFYRLNLPHFQQPGQAYFVTWSLKDAVPIKALITHSRQLQDISSKLDFAIKNKKDNLEIEDLLFQYRIARKKYIVAFDNILDTEPTSGIDLSIPELTKSIKDTLLFFEAAKIENHAFSIMPNHVHWVFTTLKKDSEQKPVYLQDILQSVKRFSANKINNLLGRKGNIWQKESFDTTIRDDKHLHNAIEYTINNPVKAGLAKNWQDWNGNWVKHSGEMVG